MASGEESSCVTSVTSKLIVQRTIMAQGKKKASTKQETKVKTFDFAFSAAKENYALFLNTILKKHGVSTKVEATDTLVYSCKFQVPPAK